MKKIPALLKKAVPDPKVGAKDMKTTMKAKAPANQLSMKGGKAKNIKAKK